MPSPDQFNELIVNTTSTWTTQDGVNGRLFTSSNGKSIFIPAAGMASGGKVVDSGYSSSIWSSMLGTSHNVYGQYLYFESGGPSLDEDQWRSCGLSIRCVID